MAIFHLANCIMFDHFCYSLFFLHHLECGILFNRMHMYIRQHYFYMHPLKGGTFMKNYTYVLSCTFKGVDFIKNNEKF